MDSQIAFLLQITQDEFDGESFNGPPLMKTLDSLSYDQIRKTETYEGYSVWAIVLHLAYWKYTLARLISGETETAPFAYEAKDWPSLPDSPSPEAWTQLKTYLKTVHEMYIEALQDVSAGDLGREIKEWGCSVQKALSWITSHDVYHAAQIRNMGVL